MKKYMLSLVFVLVTSTSLLNANHSESKTTLNELKVDIIIEDFGCLTDAYNQTNRVEAASEGGAYSWDIEKWSRLFNLFFYSCNEGYNIKGIADVLID